MANLNRSDIQAKINAYIVENTTGDITATEVAEVFTDINDSFANLVNEPTPTEATQATIQNEATTEATTYVSPRRFWRGITRALALPWTWAEKQIYSKGISLGNNASPSANGDLWFDGTSFRGRQAGVSNIILTSLNGKVGRILFVSKDGNDTTAIIGSQSFSYLTIQAAVTASASGDTIYIFDGVYTENINVVSKALVFIINKCTINGSWTLPAQGVKIIGLSQTLSVLSHTTATHFSCSNGGGVFEFENLRIISTGQTTFNMPAGESGVVYTTNCNVTCGTFMAGGWYYAVVKYSQVIATIGGGIVQYVGTPAVIGSYIETQLRCFLNVGNSARSARVINSVLYSKTQWCLECDTSVAGSAPLVENSVLVSDASNAIRTVIGALPALSMCNTKIKCVGATASNGVLSTSQYINVVSTGALDTPNVNINTSQSALSLNPTLYKLFP